MATLRPSFMLPTNFLFPPNDKIRLGIVLGEGDHGLPDPSLALNEISWTEPPTISCVTQKRFTYSGGEKTNISLGFWIDLGTLVDIGIGGERGHDVSIEIETGLAETKTFSPTSKYISELMSQPILREYTKRPRREPVYLITGVMIAQDATIQVRSTTNSAFKAKVVVNAQGFGIPVNVGPSFERDAEQKAGPGYALTQPFVLAYQLLKIRKKIIKGFEKVEQNEHALWDDSRPSVSRDDWDVQKFDESCDTGLSRGA
jgi:hypothetical protein